jgi:outer membrane protein assembly factor BamB
VNIMNFNADPVPYLFVGEANGWMHGVKAAGTALEFLTQRPGFPFRDKVSAIQGGAIMDFFTGRLFFGNAAGDLYTLKPFTGAWTLNSTYFRFATPGAAAIRTMPLYENGILYASNSAGRVFVLDANNGAGGQTLLRTFNLGTSALGDVSRDFTTNRIYVASSGGRLYSIPAITDPTVPQ